LYFVIKFCKVWELTIVFADDDSDAANEQKEFEEKKKQNKKKLQHINSYP